ncbi:MAG TPA: trimeric intracellular cation channel family protein [Luteimonas sp.]|nr:trimeric intracellular cation channel family protein [Luteimonas sp.]
METHPFVYALDLLGTFVFAISGATLGVRKRLDLFGVLVLSFAAAVSGGIARDVLIGATPPAALAGWHYVAVSCAAGLATFFRSGDVERLRNPVQLFDAVGLGLFAVTGATKALAAGLNPVSAMLLGMLTGIGGGIARDILAARIPVVLQADLYAVAALAGAAVVVAGERLGLPQAPVLAAGAVLVFVLRYLAIRRGWRLPVAPGGDAG